MSKKSENSKPKQNVRKVHFELPKADVQHRSKFTISTQRDEKKVHGTGNYVNGTLNFSTCEYTALLSNNSSTSTLKKETKSKPIIFRNQFTNDASAKNVRKNCSIDQKYWENAVHRRGILLHVSSDNQEANNITFHTSKMRRYTSILMGSNYFKRSRNQLFNYSKKKTSNTLQLPSNQKPFNKMPKEDLKSIENPYEKFSYKLIPSKSITKKKHEQTKNSIEPQPSEFNERALSIVRNAFNEQQNELPNHCTSENLSEILQLAHRWQSSTQSVRASDNVSTRESSSNSVEFCTLKKLDVKM